MSHVAFATAPEYAALVDDDVLAVDELRRRGISVSPAVWSDAGLDWSTFDAVVVRSCWDYHLEARAFTSWVDRLEADGCRLFNPPSVLRWNLDKRYLVDLEQKGVPIVPTAWFEAGSTADLGQALAVQGWDEAVVKPTISLSAHETWITTRSTADTDTARAKRVLETSGLMLQPFIREIQSEGEWSFIYFDRVLSHTVIKRPASGDFRVQNDHGGTSEPARPSDRLVMQAAAVLDGVDSELLYARVDGVEVEGEFLLMELEVIDPSLFLGHSTAAPAVFADAITRRLEQGRL